MHMHGGAAAEQRDIETAKQLFESVNGEAATGFLSANSSFFTREELKRE